MADCIDLLEGLDASCDALNKVGGVKKRVWVGQLSQLGTTPYTEDADGYVDTISFALASPTYGLHKFVGKKSKHSGTYELTAGDNVNTFNTSAILVLYHYTPADRSAIENLINSDDLFALFETEAGQIELFGITQGLNASAGSGATGVALQDSTAFTLTLSGEQLAMPKLFLNGGTLADSITYLDGISV
jgi:hypothetical protein